MPFDDVQALAKLWEVGMGSLQQSGCQVMAYGVTERGFEAIIQPPQDAFSSEDALLYLRELGFASVKQQRELSSDTDATNALETLERGILRGFEGFSSDIPGALGPTGPNACPERPAYHLLNPTVVAAPKSSEMSPDQLAAHELYKNNREAREMAAKKIVLGLAERRRGCAPAAESD